MQSSEIIQPTTIVAPLAYGGSKNNIPTAATGSNSASVTEGFPEITSLPASQGGLPPERADFNGMFYLSTDQKVYLQNGGIITFSSDVSNKIGGYPKGAVLDYLQENGSYTKVRSLIEDNTYNFVTTPSYIDNEKWAMLDFGGANIDLGNLSRKGIDKLNQSKALETGGVSTDTDVYSDIVNYAHSTFDRSKFEVVGSPTISDNGILSNCSNGNAINANISLSDLKGKSWKIKGSSILGTTIQTLVKLSSVGNSYYFNFGSILFTPTSNRISFNLKTGDISDNSTEGVKIYKDGFNSGDNVYYTISFDIETGTYYLYVDKVDGSILAGTWVATSTNKELYYINTHPEFKISYGAGSDSVNYLTTGSIDLKSIAIWADGVPILNGNKTGTDTVDEIQIPYVLSKTGSKIVDAAYRDRVQDVYDQYGISQYYTLDEENQNFTLPMGEIYGMITDKRELSKQIDSINEDIGNVETQLNNYVKKSGDSISGTLVFTKINLSGGDTTDSIFLTQHKASDYGNTTFSNIGVRNSDGQYIAVFGGVQKTNGAGGFRFGGWNSTNNQYKSLLSLTTDDNPSIVTQTYINGTTWYRLYSDGWKEQGGICTAFEGDSRYCNVTYPLAFSNNNYHLSATTLRAVMGNDSSSWVYSRTAQGARFANAQTNVPVFWQACGY